MAIILDLETVAIDGASDLVEPVSAPANYKDPLKIAAYIAEKEAEQAQKAALYPWTARIVALGWADESGLELVKLCEHEDDERAALTAFWAQSYHADDRFVRPIIGFNHRSFDLPVMLARSMLLDVKAPNINLDRYRTPHYDILDRLTWYGVIPSRSLRWYAKRFGVPCADTVTGADIAGLIAAGEWAQVHDHCLSDIRLTKALAERIGLVRGMTAVP